MSAESALLGEIATLQAGFGFPPSLQGRTTGQFPFAKVGDISRCGRSESSILSRADHYVDAADVATIRAKIVPPGSILFAKIGEAIRQNHRVVAGCEMLIDNNAMAAIPNGRVESRFLYHYLKTVDFYCLAPATTVPALRKSDLEKLRVPLPPVPEQRRIAAILDQADALRAKRREALAQLDSLTQSIFIEMFGIARSSSGGLARVRLGQAFWFQEGPGVRKWQFTNSGVKLLNVGNIEKDGSINLSKTDRHISFDEANGKYKHFLVDAGDLVIASSGISFDADGLLRTRGGFVRQDQLPLCMNTSTIRFKPKGNHSSLHYLRIWLDSIEFRSQITRLVTGSAQQNFGPSHLVQLEITLPTPSQQRTFLERVGAIEKLKLANRAALLNCDELFASLQHRAFAG